MLDFVTDSRQNPEQELRILYQFCGSADTRGGVQDAVNSIGGYVSDAGHHAHVFAGTADDRSRANDIFNNFNPANLHVLGGKNRSMTGNGSQNQLGSLIGLDRIRAEFSAVNPNIVHVQAPWMPHIGGLVLGAARRADVPAIATWHIQSDELKTNLALKASRIANWRVIRDLDAMVVVSEAAEQHMRQTYNYQGDIYRIPNAIDVDFFATAEPFEPNEPFKGYDPINNKIISFLGRPDPRKGLGELLDAVSVLQKKEPNIQLLIGSSGPELDDYKELARVFGISKITHFLGDVSDADKARLFASSDIAALPAKYGESQGIVLLEAIAAGAKVVIGGDNQGYRGVLGEIEPSDMVLTDPTRTAEFGNKLATLLDSPMLSAHIHEQQQWLVKRYDIPVIGQRVLDLYQSILR